MLSGLTPYLVAAAAFIVALAGAFIKGRVSGASKERAKHARERIEAIEEANQIQNDIGAMPPEEARKDLNKWRP